ncbi:hypothetical protein [Krasilnikovia sp. MM14-A1259]|uniref:hypothetical protein n=1 Tax=Krasilnikovia sp. MM14-A1259 TaxID=3373539 RepID=UPI0038040E6D
MRSRLQVVAALASAITVSSVLGACTADHAKTPAEPKASITAPSDAGASSASAADNELLERAVKQSTDASDIVSWAWNGTEVHVGVWADTTTAAEHLAICENVVDAVRPTGQATQVIVTAHSRHPSSDPVTGESVETAPPEVSWQSPDPHCHADKPAG